MTSLEIIKKLCEKEGMSISALEKEMGYGNGSLAKSKSIKSERLIEIANRFGVTADYLLTGKESEPNIKVVDDENNVVVLDDETLELIDSLRSKPEMKMLFSVSKNATPEDIIKAVKIIEALRDSN
ncbi:MAG: hypothetical protein PHG19_04660 [Anaerotignum sp.]|nr:hypothetical protein [Anaerotignum sp.]